MTDRFRVVEDASHAGSRMEPKYDLTDMPTLSLVFDLLASLPEVDGGRRLDHGFVEIALNSGSTGSS